MALRGFDNGDTNGPGIIRAMDLLVNVDGRPALVDVGNRYWWLRSRDVDGRGSCASDGNIGDETVLWRDPRKWWRLCDEVHGFSNSGESGPGVVRGENMDEVFELNRLGV